MKVMSLSAGRFHTGLRDNTGVDICLSQHEEADLPEELVRAIMALDVAQKRPPRLKILDVKSKKEILAKPVAEPAAEPEPDFVSEPEPVEEGVLVLTGRWMADRVAMRAALGTEEFPPTAKAGMEALREAGIRFTGAESYAKRR